MNTKKGIILILRHSLRSNSSGRKAYLIDESLNSFQLQREGHLNIDDSFFYTYANKECEVEVINHYGNTISVGSLKILEDGMFLKEKAHHSKKIFNELDNVVPSLIKNDIMELKIVSNQPTPYDSEPKRLYALMDILEAKVYFRINMQALKLFLNDRITLKEFIGLRTDEMFYLESGEEEYNYIFPGKVFEILEEIPFSDQYFTKLNADKKHQVSKEEILNPLIDLTQYGVIEVYKDFNR